MSAMSAMSAIGPSWDLVADIQLLLLYPFMRNAYLAGTLVAIMAGLLGFFLVARGQSFAAHSLTNTGFAGATGAGLVGAPPVLGLFIASALAAVGIHALGDRRARDSDIAVGAVLTASLALGFLWLRLSSSQYAGAVYDALFGNTLGVNVSDIRVIVVALALVALALVIAGRPLYFASIDPDVAAASGVPVRALDLGFLVLLAVVVAVAVQITGVLLIFALLVTPAAIARRVTPRPALALALGVALAVAFTWLGLAAGYFSPYPVGFYITTLAFVCYLAIQVFWRPRRTGAIVAAGDAA
ncbi:MAG TPA: metal ABC transporter permease [Ktedonobacterales bacterium]